MARVPSIYEVGKILKSILVSSPVKLQVYELNQQHKKLIGRDIPYREHGFEDLIDFLRIFPDILQVNGNSPFAKVNAFASSITHNKVNKVQKKRRRRKSKKKRSETTQNQIPKCPVGKGCTGVVLPGRNIRKTQDFPRNSNLKNPMRFNIPMNNKYEKNQMQLDFSSENTKEKESSVVKMPERISDIWKKEKKELRYPKTIVIIEKSCCKVRIIPKGQMMETSEQETVMVHQPCCHKISFEENRTRMNKFRKSQKIPSLNEKLINFKTELPTNRKKIEETATSPSILDEPLPPTLPEVPEMFAKSKSDDLIDFNSVIQNPQKPEMGTIENKKSLIRISVVELSRMMKNLRLSHPE